MEKGARLIKNDHDAKSFYEIVEFCGLQNDLVGSEKKSEGPFSCIQKWKKWD